MSEEGKKPILPLTKEEKEILQGYSNDCALTQAHLQTLQTGFQNVMKVALYARGLSPSTHKLNEKGEIVEIKPPEKKND